jgi:hypothetical protein
MTDGEFQQRESRTYLWLVIWLMATVGATAITVVIARGSQITTSAIIGFASATAAFAVGAFRGQLAPRRPVQSAITTGVCGALVALVAAVAAQFVRGDISMHALVLAVPDCTAFLAGLTIAPDAALLRLPSWTLFRAIALVMMSAWIAVLTFVSVTTAIVEYALRIVAWPLSALLNTRRQEPVTEHAAV